MPCCKRCESENTVKSGILRNKQRWLCKACNYNFVEGDERKTWRDTRYEKQRALATLLVCLGLSYRAAGLVVGVVRNTVYEWFKGFASNIELPKPEGKVDVVDMDEMWHFVQKKSKNAGYGKPQRLLMVQLDSSMSKWGIAAVEL
jgi:transposase-like protein